MKKGLQNINMQKLVCHGLHYIYWKRGSQDRTWISLRNGLKYPFIFARLLQPRLVRMHQREPIGILKPKISFLIKIKNNT
jgi:hypothetical protein